jgi:ABC-2 type transport system permease protein
VLYAFNIFLYGLLILPFVINLLLSGWFLGFLVAAVIIRYGQTLETLAWAGPVVIAPFAGLYYPIATLPHWAQKVALFVPPSYIFEGMRQVLFTGHLSPEKVFISLALNIVYLVISILFFVFMFNQSRKLGLGRFI